MTASEIDRVEGLLRERVEQLLSPEQLAQYDAYQRRLQAQIERHETDPLPRTPAEQAAYDLIDADPQAQGLRAQLDILTRVKVSRQ